LAEGKFLNKPDPVKPGKQDEKVEAKRVVANPVAKVETKPLASVREAAYKVEAKRVVTKAAPAAEAPPHASIAVAASHNQKPTLPYPTPTPEETDAHKESVDKHQKEMGQPAKNLEEVSGGGGAMELGREPQLPQAKDAQTSYASGVILQIVLALLYWVLVAKHYPVMHASVKPNEEAIKFQRLNEVQATMQASPSNCVLSWCCIAPRAAHTFHSTGMLNYWAGCILMSCFPMCTLWVVNSFTNLNERLGGVKRNWFKGLLCSCFCSCCVVAQDAESLDLIMGVETRLCSVRRKR